MDVKRSKSMFLASLLLVLCFLIPPRFCYPMTEDEKNNIELYRRLSPGVVNITSTVLERDFFFNIIPRQGVGSGSIIDKKGHILTNNHVIEDASKLEVTLSDGSKWSAKLVGTDPDSDLAVLKIDAPANKLVVIPFGNSKSLQVGQKVLAIGNPFGLGQTLTTGIVSSVGRTLRSPTGVLVEDVIQTDAPINPGNSGGPLIDSSGKLIGINTAIFSPTGASVGIGFAIPVDTAKVIIKELIEKGYYAYPWIGATIATMSKYFASVFGLPEEGAVIVSVVPGGPAQKAGLKGGNRRLQVGNHILIVGGDIILKFDSKKITDADQLIRLIRRHRPGDRVQLIVMDWNGHKRKVTIVLGERPRRY